jgi:Ca2+-binding RTX toxin-like protein
MVGGADNDLYIVDNAGDVVDETSGNGNDTVEASVDFELGADVENLTLTGTGDIDGKGNSVANVILGTTGANSLSGEGGGDSLSGDAGLDTLSGGDGNDTLDGGDGNDTLTGDGGADFFIGGAGTDIATDFNSGEGDSSSGVP